MAAETPDNTTWQITVNQNKCLASGICVSAAPHYFHLTKNHSTPVHPTVTPDPQLEDIADFCPANAIQIHQTTNNTPATPPSEGG